MDAPVDTLLEGTDIWSDSHLVIVVAQVAGAGFCRLWPPV